MHLLVNYFDFAIITALTSPQSRYKYINIFTFNNIITNQILITSISTVWNPNPNNL